MALICRKRIGKLKADMAAEEQQLGQLRASLASKQDAVKSRDQALAQAELKRQEYTAMLGSKELGKLSAAELKEKTELTNNLRSQKV